MLLSLKYRFFPKEILLWNILTKQHFFFFFSFLLFALKRAVCRADFVNGKRAVMMEMRRAGSPAGTLHQDALLCFQRRLYDVSHGLWFQVNKTVICEEITSSCSH